MSAKDATPVIRPIQQSELADVVNLHQQSLGPSFFSKLGARFMTAYHDTFVASPYGVALGAFDGRQLVGFVVGATDANRHRVWVMENYKWRLLVAGSAGLALRPPLMIAFARKRATRYIRRLFSRPIATSENTPLAWATLSHVAVRDDARSRGTGSQLVAAFLKGASAEGTKRVSLLTRGDVGGASTFYRKLGWTEVGEVRDSDGVMFRRFSLEL